MYIKRLNRILFSEMKDKFPILQIAVSQNGELPFNTKAANATLIKHIGKACKPAQELTSPTTSSKTTKTKRNSEKQLNFKEENCLWKPRILKTSK